ncbi:uncharacterized protein LOC133832850 [Humulus lupulus]|uniref:uncharacterized protein LOC133832850 n=1 Tax=Humulus lupulus TaxID=3486 RepID=UPI002B40C1A2|nr:uncharacterized protein LOC133832850 [Humulus lupulus]
MRELTVGSATGREVPEKHPDVEQNPPRRATGVTITEPSSTPQAAAPPVSKGKGKKKATEPLQPLNKSSDENGTDLSILDSLPIPCQLFDRDGKFNAPEAPAAPSSKRHPEESNKVPQAKKPRTAGLPEDGPSANATPPPSPHEQQTPPAPAGSTPSPAAPTDQTQQAFLALTAGRMRSGTITEQSKSLQQQHADELKAAEAKYAEQLAAMLKEKNKLAKELKEKQNSLDKSVEQMNQCKDSNRINYHEAKKLEQELIASRQETKTLEGRIKKLEKANASNLERYKNTTSKCFCNFWKHNQGAKFNYLPECARQAELACCSASSQAEEERARVLASPEISLATGMDGAENETADVVDQSPPQDPPAP